MIVVILMKRTLSRVKAMFKLYNYDLTKELLSDDYLDKILIEEELSCDNDFYMQIVNGVLDNLSKIDRVIAISLKNYTLDRLSYVDRNLIRIAAYEMMFTDTPKNIIINEILDISHEYSEIEGLETSKFNNALLDNIAKRLGNGKQ